MQITSNIFGSFLTLCVRGGPDKVYELRGLNDQHLIDWDAPPFFKGNAAEVSEFAIRHDWKWQADQQMLFGGYWANFHGKTLYPT